MKEKMIDKKNIILCVTGSIAAYKSVYLSSALVKSGANVQVILSKSAKNFVGESSFSGITHNPVITGYYDSKTDLSIDHIDIAKKADLIVVAPATANILAKISLGISSDPIVGCILASKAPVIVAPAMDGDMYNSPQVQKHINELRRINIHLSGPEKGRLASGINEFGRMTEPEDLLEEIIEKLSKKKDYEKINAIVTAGGTIEEIDPVRYISNKSSGKMGIAIAKALRDRGAKVTLIHGKLENKSDTYGIRMVSVISALEMKKEIENHVENSQLLIMSAAVADYRVKNFSKEKIKKESMNSIELEKNPDILKEIDGNKIVKVGFAAESEKLLENAKKKLSSKNCKMIVANDITLEGSGFGSDNNKAVLIDENGQENLPLMNKIKLAHKILDRAKKYIN
ncbi:MAG: bifunctional phosphopantothenoylcysteine decarboxylase/phosphopantothenate--cysteine ligase CoaBC [Chloroflexi bacterium]|jgi:phosphopantothenoylcysteine decarboxylase/phosphopantothenate--cysteine ligase|nr:bifunctional phosphopantothenoylcysteine decarboxylase/phosphopantothenate--cysteine ligase CoaBC [Chloroflexota bacterium]MEC7919561.1 bifunctional phosphopantothenoylcysteine decarboxylase/phosphopantothenate--cysteine ligase CoaBC [Chloroflexota bacterium]MQG20152.1 bifunctional phosphopantothenoylcysteine decarboxylase/phosphopantothenate--cysteine ligase CoaBC [SAR202 cluster bacterium]MQG24382.1 bifunctional phosphopantothenoylcysteine decarboxylase/phosphopantothenate--cysteine ligase |tara:strand:- start:2420 stop:3616 length:1197 start_codon:yes stop_codon:yes gene_type:complete